LGSGRVVWKNGFKSINSKKPNFNCKRQAQQSINRLSLITISMWKFKMSFKCCFFFLRIFPLPYESKTCFDQNTLKPLALGARTSRRAKIQLAELSCPLITAASHRRDEHALRDLQMPHVEDLSTAINSCRSIFLKRC